MAEHLIGKKIILKSNSEIRYTGKLHAIDTASNSISLVDVLSLGTEDRVTPGGFVPPANTIYPYVVFRAADVTDIAVIEEPVEDKPVLPHDNAILAQGAPPPPAPPAREPSPRQAPPSIVPPEAPSIATAHSSTVERVAHDLAVPSRQPSGPAIIPFDQLAAAGPSRGFAPRGRGAPRRGRGGRGPGAFSHAAEQEDVTQEFDFAGMNQRFAQIRSGEGEPAQETEQEQEVAPAVEEEKSKAPAYNKSSSFFDSVSSNIQNPQSGRGRGPRQNNRPPMQDHYQGGQDTFRGQQFQQFGDQGFNNNLPQRPQQPRGNGRFNRRDESALNEATFGEGATEMRAGRGRARGGGGRQSRGNDQQGQQ